MFSNSWGIIFIASFQGQKYVWNITEISICMLYALNKILGLMQKIWILCFNLTSATLLEEVIIEWKVLITTINIF